MSGFVCPTIRALGHSSFLWAWRNFKTPLWLVPERNEWWSRFFCCFFILAHCSNCLSNIWGLAKNFSTFCQALSPIIFKNYVCFRRNVIDMSHSSALNSPECSFAGLPRCLGARRLLQQTLSPCRTFWEETEFKRYNSIFSGTNHSGVVWDTDVFTAFDYSLSSKFLGPRVKISKITLFKDNITFKAKYQL